jgi:hypothetical protein
MCENGCGFLKREISLYSYRLRSLTITNVKMMMAPKATSPITIAPALESSLFANWEMIRTLNGGMVEF